MKNIFVEETKRSIISNEIEIVESKLNVNLPSDYKKFILKNNGGHPIKDCFPFLDNKMNKSGCIAWFYAMYDGEYSNFIKEYYTYKVFRQRLPSDLIPIADDPCGNLVCLCIDGQNKDKIYFWDHENESLELNYPWYKNISLISSNFTDFINSLFGYDLKEDDNGNDIGIYTHDKYSLPFSTEVKKFGSVIADFFAKAPSEVEDYIIEEYEKTGERILKYEVKSTSKTYIRKIDSSGEVIEDKIESVK